MRQLCKGNVAVVKGAILLPTLLRQECRCSRFLRRRSPISSARPRQHAVYPCSHPKTEQRQRMQGVGGDVWPDVRPENAPLLQPLPAESR